MILLSLLLPEIEGGYCPRPKTVFFRTTTGQCRAAADRASAPREQIGALLEAENLTVGAELGVQPRAGLWISPPGTLAVFLVHTRNGQSI